MLNEQIIEKLDNILTNSPQTGFNEKHVKRVKVNERGLIERVNSSKVILTEDNKQLLSD